MAHYVAEQIEKAEKATRSDRFQARQRCLITILTLWAHRSSLPDGRRPFESFEPIFRALEALDPDNPAPYCHFVPGIGSPEQDDALGDSDEVQQWLRHVQAIDQAARVWLEIAFHQAALHATDNKTIAWLENAANIPNSDAASIVVRLLGADEENGGEAGAELERQSRQEKLKRRIKHLEAFESLNQDLRELLVDELESTNLRQSIEDEGDSDST